MRPGSAASRPARLTKWSRRWASPASPRARSPSCAVQVQRMLRSESAHGLLHPRSTMGARVMAYGVSRCSSHTTASHIQTPCYVTLHRFPAFVGRSEQPARGQISETHTKRSSRDPHLRRPRGHTRGKGGARFVAPFVSANHRDPIKPRSHDGGPDERSAPQTGADAGLHRHPSRYRRTRSQCRRWLHDGVAGPLNRTYRQGLWPEPAARSQSGADKLLRARGQQPPKSRAGRDPGDATGRTEAISGRTGRSRR